MLYLLFWVVCGIGEDPRKYSAVHPIVALDDDAIFVRFDKIIVYQNTPDSVKQLSLAMG